MVIIWQEKLKLIYNCHWYQYNRARCNNLSFLSILLGSDHLLVIITLAVWFPEPPTDIYRKYTIIRKARLADFTAESETRFLIEPLLSSCSAGEVRFRELFQNASKHHILSGFIRNHLTNLSDEAKTPIRERDALRISNPTDPNIPSIDSQLADTIATDNHGR